MGKLGGGELNYASDVDVLFVHDGDGEEADRVARPLLATMTTPTPEAASCSAPTPTSGPRAAPARCSRTSTSYQAWYERWAQTWEFQALIKARPVAGDAALGDRFLELARPTCGPTASTRTRSARSAR